MKEDLFILVFIGLIFLFGVLFTNLWIKWGQGVGIMRGSAGEYRVIEVPSDLVFDRVDYVFSPSNGCVTVHWKASGN